MQLVISDHTKAFKACAFSCHPPLGSIVKHTSRNIRGITPPKHQRQVADALKDVFKYRNTAQKPIGHMDTYENVLPKLDKLDRDVGRLLFRLSSKEKLRTPMERFNREIKRRADVVQIFPNEQACERLIGTLCMEWSASGSLADAIWTCVLETKSLTPISSYLFTELFGLDLKFFARIYKQFQIM